MGQKGIQFNRSLEEGEALYVIFDSEPICVGFVERIEDDIIYLENGTRMRRTVSRLGNTRRMQVELEDMDGPKESPRLRYRFS